MYFTKLLLYFTVTVGCVGVGQSRFHCWLTTAANAPYALEIFSVAGIISSERLREVRNKPPSQRNRRPIRPGCFFGGVSGTGVQDSIPNSCAQRSKTAMIWPAR